MKKLSLIMAVCCFSLLIPALLASCTRDEEREDEIVSVEDEDIKVTEDEEPALTEDKSTAMVDEPTATETNGDDDTDSAKGSPAEGKQIFAQNCTPCHGQDGTGGGPTAAALDPKPRDLTDASYVSTLSNEHLSKVISGGGLAVGKSAAMPAWSTSLSDEDIQDVVAYIRVDLCNCEFEGGN